MPELAPNQVHVWRVSVDELLWSGSLERLGLTLSADERERAQAYQFSSDTKRFVLARGLLRTILGGYLNVPAGQLAFRYGPYGKPLLASESFDRTIRFNVSHSDGLAVYALSSDREVGVDIERLRPGLPVEEIARRFFSADEVAELLALPAQLRREAFFTCWTRKEAILKARGNGLSLSLSDFSVSLNPIEPAALLWARWDDREARRWSLKQLTLGGGYSGSLAAVGRQWELLCW